MLVDYDDRRHKHLLYFKPLSGLNLEPIMNTFKHSSSKLQNVCIGATNPSVLQSITDKRSFRQFLQNYSQLSQKCALKLLQNQTSALY